MTGRAQIIVEPTPYRSRDAGWTRPIIEGNHSNNYECTDYELEISSIHSPVSPKSLKSETVNNRPRVKPASKPRDMLVEPWRDSGVEAQMVKDTTDALISEKPKDDEMVNARNQHGSLSSLGSLPGCCCLPSGKTTVPEGSAGLVFRSGKFHGSLHPGENQIDPLSDSLKIIELKTQTLLIKKLNAITRDLSKVEVDCTIYWRIDPYKATLSVKNHESALKLYAEACLQSGVGKRNLKEIINNREEISEEILNLIGKKSYNWGIEISSVLVAEIVTTNRLQQTLDHMVAEKLACSVKLTSARTDADAAAFIHASSDSATSSTAMEIRKLDVLKTLSNVPNAKIIIIPNLSAGADSSSSKNLSAQKPQNPSNNQPQQLLTNALPSSTSFPTSFNVSV